LLSAGYLNRCAPAGIGLLAHDDLVALTTQIERESLLLGATAQGHAPPTKGFLISKRYFNGLACRDQRDNRVYVVRPLDTFGEGYVSKC